MTQINSATAKLRADMQAWRHDIHRHPELAFEEQRTADKVARLLTEFGLEVHAGHGLTFKTVKAVAAFPGVVELNIGHFLVGEGIFVGLDRAVAQMRAIMADARGLSLQPVPAEAK